MENKTDYIEMPNEEECLPRISLVIPFDPKMRTKSGLLNVLTAAADKSEKDLLNNFPEERVKPVINKLRCLIKDVACGPNEKNIGIFVSPLIKKVYYFAPSILSKSHLPPVLVTRNN